MTMVHHPEHGLGEIVASETTRGRTHYKVAGRGFEVWMDETEVGRHTASDAGEDLFSYAPEMAAYARAEHHIPGIPEHSPEGHGYYGDVIGFTEHEAFGSSAFAHEPPGPIIEDNEVDLPYDPFDGQYPVDMFRQEQTQSPDHKLDPEKRLRPTKSRSGEPGKKRPQPGPNPDLFAKSAGRGEPCDYCGQPGHHWSAHPEAHADVADWERERSHLEEPFGHHVESAIGDPTPHQIGPHGLGHDDLELREYAHPDMLHDDEPDWHPSDAYDFENRGPEDIYSPEHHGGFDDHAGPGPIYELENATPGRQQSAPSTIGDDHAQNGAPDMGHMAGYRPVGRRFQAAYIDGADHFDDPVQRFRDNPVGEIRRLAGIDLGYGELDPHFIEGARQFEFLSKREKKAAWRDVAAKAKRLRREGHVDVQDVSHDRIYATVQGDSGVYETMIAKGGDYGQVGQGISNWRCSCKWGQWAFKRQMTYVGRLCSHAYAAYQEMQSRHIKGDENHPFNRRRKPRTAAARTAGVVEDFKKWIKEENGGHLDVDAADRFVATAGDSGDEDSDLPLDKDDAQKVYDYAMGNVSERPERDYDQDGYTLDNEEHYKTADLLRVQPHKLSPDLVVVPQSEGDDAHYFTDLGDDRKTTGPDQIMASKWYTAKEEGHHPAFAWHSDEGPDFPDQGIVHFSTHERRSALIFTADEDLLNKLRDLSQDEPDLGNMDEQNAKKREVIDELVDRGYDASQFVAMLRRADALSELGIPDQSDQDKDKGTGAAGFAVPEGGFGGAPSAAKPGAAPPAGFNGTPLAPGSPGGALNVPQGQNDQAAGAAGFAVPKGGFGVGSGGPGGGAPTGGGGDMFGQPHTPGGVGSSGEWGGGKGGAPGGGAGGAPSGVGNSAGGGASSKGGDYTVQSGDTLSGIAQGHGGDLAGLEKGNAGAMASGTDIGKNPDLIHPGDVLHLPGGAPAGGGSAGGPPSPPVGQVSGIGPAGTPMSPPAGGGNGSHGVPGTQMNPINVQPGPAVAPPGGGGPSTNTSMGLTPPVPPPVPKAARRRSAAPIAPPAQPGVQQPIPTATSQPAAAMPAAPPAANVAAGEQAASAAMKVPSVQPPSGAAPGIHANAQRFAMEYFGADDDSGAPDSSDGKQKMPAAPPPTGAGSSYRSTAPGPSASPSGGNASGMAPGPTTTPQGPSKEMPNGAGTPSGSAPAVGPSGQWVQGPHGPVNTDGQAGVKQVSQQAGSQMGEGGPAPTGGGGMPGSGGGMGNVMSEIGSGAGALSGLLGEIPGIGPALSGLGSGLGGALSGIGNMFHGSTESERFAARYFQADGSFLGEGGIDQADYPFAGSGPDRQDWSTTSEDWIDEHEKGNRDETWHTDNDGDITTYTSPRQRPKQAAVLDDDRLSASAREFWADAFDPGQQGYFNPNNRPYQEDDSDQYKPDEKRHGQGDDEGQGGGGMFGDLLGGGGGEAAGGLEEAAPLLLAASADDDNDIVRQFQASAGAAALKGGGGSFGGSGGGRFDDFAGAAERFLKTAGRVYSPDEQRALEEESHPGGARNLGSLQLEGTHYE